MLILCELIPHYSWSLLVEHQGFQDDNIHWRMDIWKGLKIFFWHSYGGMECLTNIQRHN